MRESDSGDILVFLPAERDIRELGLVKTPDGYRQFAAESNVRDIDAVIQEFLRDVRVAQNLLVLRTPPGSARSRRARGRSA